MRATIRRFFIAAVRAAYPSNIRFFIRSGKFMLLFYPFIISKGRNMIFAGYMREYLGAYPEKDLRKAINKAIDRKVQP